MIHLSIVSHGQGALTARLLHDLSHIATPLVVTLTLNRPEPFDPEGLPFPLDIIRNPFPKGFGANHNAAFRRYPKARCFCIANPDIRLEGDPFPPLLAALEHPGAGAAAPLVLHPSGRQEDSVRPLPTPWGIAKKALGLDGITVPETPQAVEWAAGMFLCFKPEAFAQAGGFDERYFLYYEDVDLCCRLRLLGQRIAFEPRARVIHEAQRASRRDLTHLRWHLASMGRFFMSSVFWRSLRRGPERP